MVNNFDVFCTIPFLYYSYPSSRLSHLELHLHCSPFLKPPIPHPPKPTHAHPRPPTPTHPPTHTHLQAIGGPQTRGGPRLIDGGADTPPQRRSRRASRVPVASASNVAVGEIVVERMSASSQNEAVGQNLDALLAMGYTDQSAVAALAHTGGFLEPAIELLSADPEFGKRP